MVGPCPLGRSTVLYIWLGDFSLQRIFQASTFLLTGKGEAGWSLFRSVKEKKIIFKFYCKANRANTILDIYC